MLFQNVRIHLEVYTVLQSRRPTMTSSPASETQIAHIHLHALNKTLPEEMLIYNKYTEILVESMKASYSHFIEQRQSSIHLVKQRKILLENFNAISTQKVIFFHTAYYFNTRQSPQLLVLRVTIHSYIKVRDSELHACLPKKYGISILIKITFHTMFILQENHFPLDYLLACETSI